MARGVSEEISSLTPMRGRNKAREKEVDVTSGETLNEEPREEHLLPDPPKQEAEEERVSRRDEGNRSFITREYWSQGERVRVENVEERYQDERKVSVKVSIEWFKGGELQRSEEVTIGARLFILMKRDAEGRLHSEDGEPSYRWKSGGFWIDTYHHHGQEVRSLKGSPEEKKLSISERLDRAATSGSNMLKTLRRRYAFAREISSLILESIRNDRQISDTTKETSQADSR